MSANKFEKFYFTDYGNRDIRTFPILLKTSEKHIRILLKPFISSINNVVVEDHEEFHEFLIRYDEFETTFLFLKEDNTKTLLNIVVYGKKRKHAYKEILRIIDDINKLLKEYIIEDFIHESL